MPKKITVVIKEPERQYEGLRYSLGLMFERHDVCMVVLNHEVESTMLSLLKNLADPD